MEARNADDRTDAAILQELGIQMLMSEQEDEPWRTFSSTAQASRSLATLEFELDKKLTELLDDGASVPQTLQQLEPASASPAKKKRGRRPLRPNDPIKKKTEEKDKYWLRAFRAFMKSSYSSMKSEFTPQEVEFWESYIAHSGKPEKGRAYLSYGKRYKNYLFSHATFANRFQAWFYKYAQIELAKKCTPGSALWEVFYNYAVEELLHYVPRGSSSLEGAESPLSQASPAIKRTQTVSRSEFSLILDEESALDGFLSKDYE